MKHLEKYTKLMSVISMKEIEDVHHTNIRYKDFVDNIKARLLYNLNQKSVEDLFFLLDGTFSYKLESLIVYGSTIEFLSDEYYNIETKKVLLDLLLKQFTKLFRSDETQREFNNGATQLISDLITTK